VDKPCRWPLIVAALIAYGSLYPFGFALPASFGAFWNELLAQRRLWTGLGDVAGNVLLFIPLGAAAVLCVGARHLTVLRAAQLLVAASVFSFAVQVLQVFEPTRNPALSDVFWNAIGSGVGIGAGFALERYVALLPRAAWGRSRVALVLIVAWVAAELWPFVPSLDGYAIKQTLKPLLLAPSFSLPSFVYHFVGVLVLGMLLAASAATPRVGLRLAALVLGVLAGKLLFQAAPLSFSFASASVAGVAAWAAGAARLGRGATLVLLGALLAAYTLRALAPFELRGVPEPFRWIPFQALLEGSMSANVRSLLAQLFAFGAMLWLVERAGARLPGAAAALALWVGLIEVAQMWIVGRTPDITPALLVIAIAIVLARLDRGEALARGPAVS
jgi:VanZ family protein